jgi:hypothetical protein
MKLADEPQMIIFLCLIPFPLAQPEQHVCPRSRSNPRAHRKHNDPNLLCDNPRCQLRHILRQPNHHSHSFIANKIYVPSIEDRPEFLQIIFNFHWCQNIFLPLPAYGLQSAFTLTIQISPIRFIPSVKIFIIPNPINPNPDFQINRYAAGTKLVNKMQF